MGPQHLLDAHLGAIYNWSCKDDGKRKIGEGHHPSVKFEVPDTSVLEGGETILTSEVRRKKALIFL